jgi:hypothetical protein
MGDLGVPADWVLRYLSRVELEISVNIDLGKIPVGDLRLEVFSKRLDDFGAMVARALREL